jgi:hypothetical protein
MTATIWAASCSRGTTPIIPNNTTWKNPLPIDGCAFKPRTIGMAQGLAPRPSRCDKPAADASAVAILRAWT